MKTVYFSVSLETFRMGDSEAVSSFDLTRQKQPLKVTQLLKNRLRLLGSGQTLPEIIPELRNPLAQEAKTTNQISFMPYSKAHLCTHLSVHILTCPQPHHTVILLAEFGLCQYWRKKEQQKEKKEGMTF